MNKIIISTSKYIFLAMLILGLFSCNNSGGGTSTGGQNITSANYTDSNIGILPKGAIAYSSIDKYNIPNNEVTTGTIQAIDNYNDSGHFTFSIHPTHNIPKPDTLPIVETSITLCKVKPNSANVCTIKIIGNNASVGHYMIVPEFVGDDGKIKNLNHIALEIIPKSTLSQNGTLAISLTKLSKQDNDVTATISLNNSINVHNLPVFVSNYLERKNTCLLSTVNNSCQIKINKNNLADNSKVTPENSISAMAANYTTALKPITTNGHIVLSLPYSGIITNETVYATITLKNATGVNNLKVTLSSSDPKIVGIVHGSSCIIANSHNNNSCQITLAAGKIPFTKEAEIIATADGYTASSHHLGVSQILVGTNNGIYSADGTLFSTPNNLGPYIPTSPNISGLTAIKGHLYIGSYNQSSGNGATIEDYNTSTQYVTPDALSSSSFGNSEFEAISERNGIVYIATSDNYITSVYGYINGAWILLHSDSQNYSIFTGAIAVKHQGNQIVIYELYSNGHLARYSKPADNLPIPSVEQNIAGNVTSIAMTSSGVLIYSDVNGYVHSYDDTAQNHPYGEIASGAQVPGGFINYIAVNNEGDVYAISSGGYIVSSSIGKYDWVFQKGVVISNRGNNAKMAFDLSTNNLFIIDGNNELFEIPYNQTITQFSPLQKRYTHHNVMQILFDDSGKLFAISSPGGRVLRYDSGIWNDLNFPSIASGALFFDTKNNLIVEGFNSNSITISKYFDNKETWKPLLNSEWYTYLNEVGITALGITSDGQLLIFPQDYNYGYMISSASSNITQSQLNGLPGVFVNNNGLLISRYPTGLVVTKGNSFATLNSATSNPYSTLCGTYSIVCYKSMGISGPQGWNTQDAFSSDMTGGTLLDYDIGNDRFNVLYIANINQELINHVAYSVSGKEFKNVGNEITNLSVYAIIAHDVEGNLYVVDTNNNMYRVTNDNTYKIGSGFGGNTINQSSIAIWPYVHYSLAF